jgi:hypothetical protein
LVDFRQARWFGFNTQVYSLCCPALDDNEVTSLYDFTLGRNPDPQGLNFGISMLARGRSMNQLEANLLGSNEFFQQQSGNSNKTYLTNVYLAALQRFPDPGSSVYLDELNSGVSRTTVATTILDSTEASMVTVDNLYLAFLGRQADPGAQGYINMLHQSRGAALNQVVVDITTSNEFISRATTG